MDTSAKCKYGYLCEIHIRQSNTKYIEPFKRKYVLLDLCPVFWKYIGNILEINWKYSGNILLHLYSGL